MNIHHRYYEQITLSIRIVTLLLFTSTNPSVIVTSLSLSPTENASIPFFSKEMIGAWLLSIWNEPVSPGREIESTSPLKYVFSGVMISSIISRFRFVVTSARLFQWPVQWFQHS